MMGSIEYLLEIELLRKRIVELEAQVAKYKWQKGHPEHNNMVFVYMEDSYGNKYYGDNHWRQTSGRWQNTFSGKQILGWKEIEPFDLEEGE